MRDVFSTMDDLRQTIGDGALRGGAGLPDDAAAANLFELAQCACFPGARGVNATSWRTEITRDQAAREGSGSRCIPGCARGPRCLLRGRRCCRTRRRRLRYTTYENAPHRAPGRPPVGTPTGSVASTCSPPTLRAAPIERAGFGVPEEGGEQSAKPPKPSQIWGLVRVRTTAKRDRQRLQQEAGSVVTVCMSGFQAAGSGDPKSLGFEFGDEATSFFVGIHAGGDSRRRDPSRPAGGQHVLK